jgi:CBS domain-containing protein
MVQIITPTKEHTKDLAPRLRPEDIIEITVASPELELEEILNLCVETSTDSYAVVDEDDGCVAIFGVRDMDKDSGIPWFLSCDLFFTKYKKRFIKEGPEFLKKLFGSKKHLYNYVSQDNTRSQRWLQSLGFTIYKQEIKFKDVVFYAFDKKGN